MAQPQYISQGTTEPIDTRHGKERVESGRVEADMLQHALKLLVN